MTIFDQKNQTVGYQYNAAGNINIDNSIKSREGLINELEKLKFEITQAVQAKIIDSEVAAKAEQKLERAIQNSKKSKPNKKTVWKYIKEAAELLSGIPALLNLATEITKAGKLALELFSSSNLPSS